MISHLHNDKVGDNILKAMNIIGVYYLGFVSDITTRSQSLVLRLQFDIIGEPNNATQRGINLLPSGLINVGNVFSLFGQVVGTTLTLKPQLDNSNS